MILALLIRLVGKVVRGVLACRDTYVGNWQSRDRRERLARLEGLR